MNETALRYRIYKVLLESDLTQLQRETLNEILSEGGWIDNLKAWAGAAKDTGAFDIGKVFANNKFSRRVKIAGETITKEIEELKSIAKAAGIGEDAMLSMLSAILKGSGASPAELASAEKSTVSGGGSAPSGGKSASPVAGSPVTPENVADNPSLMSTILAAVTGKTKEETEKAVESKKPNAVTLIKTISDSISKSTGVDPVKAAKIIKALMDTGHVVVEGRSLYQVRQLSESYNAAIILDTVLERWQKIAGLNILLEGPATDDIVDGLKNKKIKNDDQLKSAIKGYKGDDLADLEKNKGQVVGAVRGNPAFPGFDKKFEEMLKDMKTNSSNPAANPAAGGAKEKDPGFDLEAGKKEFANAFKEVRSKIKEAEATDEELIKVMKALDLKDEIAVK